MKALIVAAHPDDEILGCGGTVAKLNDKYDFYTLILGEGIASRALTKNKVDEQKSKLKENAEQANNSLGVKKIFFEDLPDNKFDTMHLLDIVKLIEQYIDEIKPELILTHHGGDLNIDHKITNNALFTAARPLTDSNVKNIMLFEVLSSTEWCEPGSYNQFIPNTYIDIASTIDKKLGALSYYQGEMREFPHPRSFEGVKILSQKRGMDVGLRYAEAFFLARCII